MAEMDEGALRARIVGNLICDVSNMRIVDWDITGHVILKASGVTIHGCVVEGLPDQQDILLSVLTGIDPDEAHLYLPLLQATSASNVDEHRRR